MRGISLSLAVGAASVWLVAVAAAQPPAGGGLTREALERAGATIRAIHVTVDNVFDPSNPDEDKKLYRWANKVHVRTRDSVIEDILLLAPGDPFVARLLDESARTLRARGFIAEAVVEPGTYDPATNSVDINVRVRDSWSLALDLKLNRKGGETEWGLGLSDNNLFGTGKTLDVGYESEIDRDQTTLGYADGNLFGSRARMRALLANASDGHRRELVVERPFFALDTRWSLGGIDPRRAAHRHDVRLGRGDRRVRARHRRRSRLQGGWSRGLIERHTQRWLFGLTSEEHTFRTTPDVPQPLLLPANRKLVYPWVGWQLDRGRLSRDERAQRHGPHRRHSHWA